MSIESGIFKSQALALAAKPWSDTSNYKILIKKTNFTEGLKDPNLHFNIITIPTSTFLEKNTVFTLYTVIFNHFMLFM